MTIETLEIAGLRPAVLSARLSYDSVGDGCGPKDMALLAGLADRSNSEGKALRMVMAWAAIRAPRYWWSQFDTYRAGVEKGSQSTMHTLLRRPTTVDDYEGVDPRIIEIVNEDISRMDKGQAKKDLPESYLQKRIVMMSYAAIRNIYHDRIGHELPEWKQFCNWAMTLPHADQLVCGGKGK